MAMLKAASRLPVGQEKTGNASRPPNILLIRPDHLGDILFSTPALSLLRQALPAARITYMVGPWSSEIVAHNPNIDEVMSYAFPGFSRSRRRGSLLDPYKALRKEAEHLRSFHFDAAINLRFDFWWGAMLARFAAIPLRLGYDVRECKPFLSHMLPYLGQKHEVERNLDLVRQFVGRNPDGSRPPLEFNVTPSDESFAEEFLSSFGDGPFIAIHPGTGWPVKQWPVDRFAELGGHLAHQWNATVIVTGATVEHALVTQVTEGAGATLYPLLGARIGQLAAVLKRCNLVVGGDSGVLHLAVAMGAPTVHIYGPVSDQTFGPWGDPSKHVVVKASLDCIPCDRLDFPAKEIEKHCCVKDIPIETVLNAAESLLKKR